MRVLDANRNRVLEALRVIEDHARFVREDASLARRAKGLRHRVQQALSLPELSGALAERDALSDPGHPDRAPDERPRADVEDVLAANFGRAKEGLRVLEEYTKVAAPAASQPLSACRYAVYALEADAQLLPSLAAHRVYALLGSAPGRLSVLDQARALLAGGVRLFQLREKHLDDRALLALASALVELCAEAEALVIVNDRPDLARLAGAAGVHVGREDLPAGAARRIVGASAHVGASTHDPAEVQAAIAEGATHLGFGTLFPSSTKPELGSQGLAALRELARDCPLPIYGIGGVTRANARSVLEAGAHGVAVSSDVLDAADPEAAARELVAVVEGATGATSAS